VRVADKEQDRLARLDSLITVSAMAGIVRSAQLSDVAQIIIGYRWLFEPPASQPPQGGSKRAAAALRRAISAESAVVLIVEVDGEFAGFATGYDAIGSVRFGLGVGVEDLAVHPAHRSRGIGQAAP
jgi:GNAT superfamily N-acetyltransferase